ncbi:serine/threonine-protein kinase [Rhodobacter calidifons]|uniref:Serine/threonine protein kinase n=1 Tax=Rhodobacter calidifons TaxID=2715277 RepID=A0ABX0G6U7_9RHOB|nr:serine/threonine-protein kinase [Rhodobacter calidifons]NHB76471.1 serine/threonine protein kinase [Rhodobacter calidifons]
MALDTSDLLARSDIGDELLPGTTLFHGSYRITRFINSGGFGITYLAQDSLGREVVIKECFSSNFCRRSQSRVRARSAGTREHLSKLVRAFLREAQSLALLRHPNIVGVHQVFEENDTAYMVLDYIRGHDLLEIIDEKPADLTPAMIVRMTGKLVAALAYIHDNQLLHCDIAPDNIFVTPAGEPVLIDFGASRRTAAGAAQKYSGLSVVKDGYSPHELYTVGGNSGPWSDIYALAASLYHAISGQAPENCQTRLSALAEKRADPCKPLAGHVAGYPPGFLETIDRAMAVMPTARFQSAADWLKALPQPEPKAERKVVLVRRVVPAPAAATEPARETPRAAAVPVAPVVPMPARPRRPATRVAEVDLSGLRRISGFRGGWLIDALTGSVMASEAGGAEPEVADRALAAVAQANLQAFAPGDAVEDIQIARTDRLHLIRPLDRTPHVFICVTLDRETANPALARMQLRRVAQAVRL